MKTTAEYASATDEDLQVAEDALREQGRHEEANRLMGLRRFEPLMRAVAAARDVSNRLYAENGNSFKSRVRKKREEIDRATVVKMRAEEALEHLIWEVFGTFVSSWQQRRADELGKPHTKHELITEAHDAVLF